MWFRKFGDFFFKFRIYTQKTKFPKFSEFFCRHSAKIRHEKKKKTLVLTHRSIHTSKLCSSAKLTMNVQFSSVSFLHPSSSSSSFVAAERHPICFADAQGRHCSEQHQAHANKTTGEGKGHCDLEQKEGVFSMASALCPVASVVSVAPRCSVESSSSSSSGGVCGSNSITSSSFGSSSVKLPLVAQQQAFPGSSMPISLEMTVADPSLQYANLMWFRGSYNAQVFVGEDEPADSVVRRFRKAVMMAGVIPECRRRRFFETPQDIVKRKQQNARRKKPRFSSIITTSLLLSCSCPGLAYPVVESSSCCGRLLERCHDASSVVELSSCNVESSHKLLDRKQRERKNPFSVEAVCSCYFEAKFLGLCPISSTSSLCGLLRYVSFLNRDLENLPCYSILVHRTQFVAEIFCAGMSHGKHLKVFVI